MKKGNFKEIPIEMLDTFLHGTREDQEETIEKIKKGIKKLLKKKDFLLKKCVQKGMIKTTEKKKYSNDYLIDYINLAANKEDFKNKEIPAFVTVEEEILKRKKDLTQKFGIKIETPKSALNIMGKKDPEQFKRIKKEHKKHLQEKKDQTNYIG